MPIPRIAITVGELAGIGPDILINLAQRDWPVELVAIGSAMALTQRAEHLNLPLSLTRYHAANTAQASRAGHMLVCDCPSANPVVAGHLDPDNASTVIDSLTRAADGALRHEFAALVTLPVHKGILNDAGISFSGHTEFFAEHAQVNKVVMMLASDAMRVALVTTHLPLRNVADAITEAEVEQTLRIVDHDLRVHFGIQQPRLLVCGLNPHAGEGGHLGDEEIRIIEPVIARLTKQGFTVQGPLPADTLFQPKYLQSCDAVIAMYHDQGLPVLKYQGFGRAMNITLGLPYIRTSVDHGTALDLAATAQIDIGSAEFALAQAIKLAQQAQHSGSDKGST